jgi:NADPH:quinone reductase-like Zn-dependent oxidoreductase
MVVDGGCQWRRSKTMTKAVRYDEFGGIDVLRIDEVNRPVPEDRQVLVQVRAAGINPGEAAIRTGAMADIFPSTFRPGRAAISPELSSRSATR